MTGLRLACCVAAAICVAQVGATLIDSRNELTAGVTGATKSTTITKESTTPTS